MEKKNENGDWEVRPGGMLVQKRDPADDENYSDADLIKIIASYGSSRHEIVIPSDFTFGALKSVIAEHTGLEPKDQQILFRGKNMEDGDQLNVAGMKNLSKVLILEDQESKEAKVEDMKASEEISRACNAVVQVRAEVDKHSEKVVVLAGDVYGGNKVVEKDFILLTELLMRELLKLDGIEAVGEANVKRKMEVRRIQSLVKTLDNLKARKLDPFSNQDNVTSVTTEWETFEAGVGSLNAPPPTSSSSYYIVQD